VVTIDTTPPTLSIPTLAAGSDNGISTTDRVTGVTRPTLTGTAEPNATVTLFIFSVHRNDAHPSAWNKSLLFHVDAHANPTSSRPDAVEEPLHLGCQNLGLM